MYHIMICDDDKVYVDFMKATILHSGMKKTEVMFYEYYCGEELLSDIENQKSCDLLILDMQMQNLDGHETAAHFRKVFPESTLVFCSGVCQPSVETFKVTPFRYLLKSYTDEHMRFEMKAIIQEMISNKSEPYIVAKYYYNIVKLKPSDILYIENVKHGSIIHVCKDKIEYSFENNVTTNQKIGELYVILQLHGFEYAHNSYLVNLKYVTKMLSEGELKLADGTILGVSRSKLKGFRKALSENLALKY